MEKPIRVAALQMHAKPRAYDENKKHAEKLIREAAEYEPDILVMPEMFLYGHFYEKDRNKYKESINGPTLEWMKQLSRELNIMLVGGINEEIEGEELCYSTLLLVDGKELIGTYRKRNPASAEILFLKQGSGDSVFETRLGKIGLLTCFDMSYPDCLIESFNKRIDLLLVSNAWPMMEKMPFLAGQKFEHHTVLPRAIAMQLRAPVAVSNMIGDTNILVPGLSAFGGGVYSLDTEFTGGSFICDHMGVVLDGLIKEDGAGFAISDLNLTFSRGTREVTLDQSGIDELRSYIFK